MDDTPKRSFGLAEAIAVLTVLGTVIVAYGRITDRIAIMETNLTTLRVDVDKIENGSPLVNARLDQQRKDIDDIERRLNQQEDKNGGSR